MYGKEYFIDSKISNYKDYREKKYGGLCEDIIRVLLDINTESKIVDYGCATGILVKEFVDRGYDNIKGTDISARAINNGMLNGLDKYLEHYNPELLSENNDYVFMLDVLEHIPSEEQIRTILDITKGSIVVRIPVTGKEGGKYVLDISENDKTHIQRHTKERWENLFDECGYDNQIINETNIYESDGVLARLLTKNV